MIYLIKFNLILALLCLLFQVLMHRDTFFGVRRLMLWGIYATAFLLPLCDVQALLTADTAATDMAEAYASYVLPTIEVTAMRVSTLGIEQSEPGCGMWFVGMLAIWAIIYLIPVVWMTLKLLWQFAYIIYLRCTCKPIQPLTINHKLLTIYSFPRPCSPFSFGPWIFIHPDGMDEQTLREVLIHEQAHVRGWHTLDILFSQVVCILFWWNPAAWLMRREVRMNLEFIADKAVADYLMQAPLSSPVGDTALSTAANKRTEAPSGTVGGAYSSRTVWGAGSSGSCVASSLKAYQYRLLGFATQTNVATIANNFNVLPLKRRIIMMNLRRTRRTGMVKYILFVPVAAAMLLLSNIDSLARTIESKVQETPTKRKAMQGRRPPVQKTESLLVVNGTVTEDNGASLSPEDVNHVYVLGKESARAVYGVQSKNGVIVVETKDGGDPIYDIVEQLPKYPGGEAELYGWMAMNLKYPAAAMEWGVQGRVIVTFVVEKDGTLTDISAAKLVDPKSGQEMCEIVVTAKTNGQTPEEVEAAKHLTEGIKALKAEGERVVKALPKRWEPGKQGGKPVRVRFNLPITFRLQ